jgi:hypothetical protein
MSPPVIEKEQPKHKQKPKPKRISETSIQEPNSITQTLE